MVTGIVCISVISHKVTIHGIRGKRKLYIKVNFRTIPDSCKPNYPSRPAPSAVLYCCQNQYPPSSVMASPNRREEAG